MKKLPIPLYCFIKNRVVLLLRFFILSILLAVQCSFLGAQDVHPPSANETVPITVVGGAEIHSTDRHFNQQVTAHNNTAGSITISKADKNGGTRLVMHGSLSVKKRGTVASSVKYPPKQKIINILRKFKKELVQYEQQKSSLQAETITLPSSTTHFFQSRHYAPFYVVPSITSPHFFNIYRTGDSLALTPALDYLYVHKFYFYNQWLSSPSFLEILLVRPPPVTG